MAVLHCLTLFVACLLFNRSLLCLAISITPPGPLCSSIKANALLSLGSHGWGTRSPTFGAIGKLKTHYFVKYVVESSGTDAGISAALDYNATKRDFLDGQPPDNWQLVTGWAEVGDLVVDSKGMGIIVKLGDEPTLLSEGKVVVEGKTPSKLWSRLNNAAQGQWGKCQDQIEGTLLNPAEPPPPCLPWVRDERMLEEYDESRPRLFLQLRSQSIGGQELEDVRFFDRRSILAVFRLVTVFPAPAPFAYPQDWITNCDTYGTFLRFRAGLPLPKCPSVQKPSFTFFNRREKNGVEVTLDVELSASYDPLQKTIIIVHGFQSKGETGWVTTLRQSLLHKDNYNVIVVDWAEGDEISLIFSTLPMFHQEAANTQTMGALVARVIQKLVEEGGTHPSQVWCMGHSLGAHICGRSGMVVQKLIGSKIARVTGFDPVGPTFDSIPLICGVNPESATFVDVIHIDVRWFGSILPRGHMDFYPNDGELQPKCSARGLKSLGLLNIHVCNHEASYEYFTESIKHNCFAAMEKCERAGHMWKNCTISQAPLAYMGYHAPGSGPYGIYRLTILKKHPFCDGPEAVMPRALTPAPTPKPTSSSTPATTRSSTPDRVK